MFGQLELDNKMGNQKRLRNRVSELEETIVDIFPSCNLDNLLGTLNNFFKDGDNDGYIYYVDDVTVDVLENIGSFESVLIGLAGDVKSSKYKKMVLDIIGWNLEYHYLASGSDESPFKELFAFNIATLAFNNWREMGGVNINENIISVIIEHALKHKHVLYEKKRLLVKSDTYGFVNTDSWDKEKGSYSYNLLLSLGIFSEEKDLFVFTKLISNSIIEMLVSEVDAADDNHPIIDLEKSNYQKGVEYEDECIGLFRESGWTALETPKSGDAGADIIATKRGLKVAVQCKSWSSNVGTTAIQEVVSAKGYYDADFAILLR